MWKSNYSPPYVYVPQPNDPRYLPAAPPPPVQGTSYGPPRRRAVSVTTRPPNYPPGNSAMRTRLQPPVANSARTESWVEVDPASVKKDAVKMLLGQVGMIRVGVEVARGRGSVSASMAALKELKRQAADRTVFQVVHERGAESGLSAVVDGFDSTKARQYCWFEGQHILFVKEGNLTREDMPTSGKILGFVGANDGPDHHASRWMEKLGSRLAGDVVAVGIGQPYDWKYGGAQSIAYRLDDVSYIHYQPGTVKGYPIHVPRWTADGIRKVINQEAVGSPTRTQQMTLARVFAELSYGNIEMMPLYGLHHPVMKKTTGREDDLLRDLCGGIKLARQNGLGNKPVVLAVIGNYMDELRRLGQDGVSSQWNPNKVAFADQADADRNIKYLDKGDIMVLYLGPVPQRYFDQLFRLSTLPPIVEGANAANLCQNLPDKPYLHMNMGGTDFPVTSAKGGGRQAARSLSRLLESNDGTRRTQTREEFSRFILNGRQRDSDVSKYFRQVNGDTSRMNQVTELLYPIAEALHIGPSIPKPSAMQIEKSPDTNIAYERWSDGKVYYSRPGSVNKNELSLDTMAPYHQGQKSFAREHWDDPVDLKIANIKFDRRNALVLLSSRSKRGLPLLRTQTTANNNSYLFSFDESRGLLTLVEKNGEKVAPQVYSRNNVDDESNGAKAARYQGPRMLRKARPPQQPRTQGVPLTRWTSNR